MSVGARPLTAQQTPVVRMALLHDAQGKLLALLPADGLLNLAAVWRSTGRQLQPASCADTRRFFAQEAFVTDKGRRQLLSLPLLCDERVELSSAIELWEPVSELRFEALPEWLAQVQQRVAISQSCTSLAHEVNRIDDQLAITAALERFTELRVRQRLDEVLGLPGFSQTTSRILQLRSNPDGDVDELLDIVRLDPAVSAQIMSWAASPYYAAPGQVDSVEDAVIRVLGYDLVINLTLGVAMGRVLAVPKNPVRGATPFWFESVAVAAFCEELVLNMPARSRPPVGLMYLSGLLHNFGYLLLAHLFPSQFSMLSRYIEANPHLAYALIEQKVLQLTREQVGAWLLESWQLPPLVCRCVRYQNTPEEAGEFAASARILLLAKMALREQGLIDGPVEAIPAVLLDQLGIAPEVLSATVQSFARKEEALRQLTELMSRD